MLLTTGLVRKLTTRINNLYQQSISREDAWQIGSFGVARAAYRYHPSFGGRFSTFASHWILREVQLQALSGRLVRIPVSLVERLSLTARNKQTEQEEHITQQLRTATPYLIEEQIFTAPAVGEDPAERTERIELLEKVSGAIEAILSEKNADVLKRRYGIGEYRGSEQSVAEIAKLYGVTRGCIYQREKAAMAKLKKHFTARQIADPVMGALY
jgi:RNA polymerase sigma factor (sigma-70 family)